MRKGYHLPLVAWALLIASGPIGCRSTDAGGQRSRAVRSASQPRAHREKAIAIRRIACLFDQRPWLNLDTAGDRDPEGLWYRVYLDPGIGRGVLAEGEFHVEMYLIDAPLGHKPTRTLISDWHYPSTEITRIDKPGMLGEGYVLQLRWAEKSVAGKEIEVITRFEDSLGNVARAGTKRLRGRSRGCGTRSGSPGGRSAAG